MTLIITRSVLHIYILLIDLFNSLSFCVCPEIASTEVISDKVPWVTDSSRGHGGETGLWLMLIQSIALSSLVLIIHILAMIWTHLSIFRFQVVRLKLENSKRIVGTLIPNTAMTALLTALDEGSEGKEETIYWKTQILQEKIARSRQISLSHELQPMWAQRYV